MGDLTGFEKLLPVALAFGVGVWFARRNVIEAATSKAFSDFTFLFAIPCYLFANIYASNLHLLFNWPAIFGYASAAGLCLVLVAVAVYAFVSRDAREIALRMMAGVQVNTAYFAVPVFIMLFNTAAPIFPILLFQVCILTVIVIAILELGRTDSEASTWRRLGSALWSSLATPLVLACNLAIVLNLLSVPVPGSVLSSLSFIGASASPVALFALGLHLGGSGLGIRDTTREEVALILLKCVAFPVLAYLVCRELFGVRGPWLDYVLIIAAMPSPQNVFIFAQRYGVGVRMAAANVVKTSVVSLLLLPVWALWVHTS